jgi:nucleotide-binding universal stress UspA family protein
MKTILLATDFSPAARNAGYYAAEMAMAIQADLLLFNVLELPVTYYELPVAVDTRDISENEELSLLTFKKELEEKTSGKVKISTKVRTGGFFDELSSICEQMKPYAVIMGSQGTTATNRLLFGGHTVHAMQNINWPLMTIPPGVHFSAVKKICLSCDLHHVLNTIPLEEIRALVKQFHAELHIVNTGKRDGFTAGMMSESGWLQEMFADLQPEYHFISSKNSDQAVIDFCEKNQIDLLVVLPKHHGFIENLIYKSHTKELVLHSHVPVMALHSIE